MSDTETLEWLVWFARKSKGTVAEVTQRALDQNPYLLAAAPRSGEDEAYRRGFTDGRGEPPERGTVTQCPIEGVHEHTFRGPHGFREWLGAPREASEPKFEMVHAGSWTREYLRRKAAPREASEPLDPRVATAFDLLGGMWSWHDDSITSPLGTPGKLADVWWAQAGALLREVVGRPARNPLAAEASEPPSTPKP